MKRGLCWVDPLAEVVVVKVVVIVVVVAASRWVGVTEWVGGCNQPLRRASDSESRITPAQ